MRALIITGGQFHKSFSNAYLEKTKERPFDLIICADKGLKYALELGLEADFAIGDFDSFPLSHREESQLEESQREDSRIKKTRLIRLHCEKDATDTQEAISLAISKGAREIHLLAGMGDRLDHTLANLFLLTYFEGVKLYLIDEKNRVGLLRAGEVCRITKKEQHGSFISLVPLSSELRGVTVTGCKYNLRDAVIRMGDSIGISNEITEEARITFEKGMAFLIESKD